MYLYIKVKGGGGGGGYLIATFFLSVATGTGL